MRGQAAALVAVSALALAGAHLPLPAVGAETSKLTLKGKAMLETMSSPSGGDHQWSEVPVSNHRLELSIMFSDDDGKT